MSLFRRRRGQEGDDDSTAAPQEAYDTDDLEQSEEVGGSDDLDEGEDSDGGETRPAPSPRLTAGPWDVADVADPADGGRIDLGGVWIPGREGLEVRVEADQQTGEVVAVTLVYGDGALQLQPFAAPRSEGIWGEVRAEIRAGITQQGGTCDEVEGPLGAELRTKVPVRAQDGSSGVQPARFVGVDGPRWFLRGVITGRPAVEQHADDVLIELFRDVVVVRGAAPMAPREPIPLTLPSEAAEDGQQSSGDDDPLNPFARGPEITEIR
ncbi:MAG: hypothetical protein QOI54_1224 [Actinomycetota bacterium]|nr:hypothetical protein [Actinomycetota bacterium]